MPGTLAIAATALLSVLLADAAAAPAGTATVRPGVAVWLYGAHRWGGARSSSPAHDLPRGTASVSGGP
jgi:hypothetical protein